MFRSSSHNIHCAKKEQKTCTVKINEVSCRYNEEKNDAERYINYTYDSSCPSEKHGIIWDWSKDFTSKGSSIFNHLPSYSQPTIISERKSDDWSITRTTLLNPPWWIWGLPQFYIKVVLWERGYNGSEYSWKQIGSLWQENWQVFTVERKSIEDKNECRRHNKSTKQRVDWNGQPFEWEIWAIYDSNKNKVWTLERLKACEELWREYNSWPTRSIWWEKSLQCTRIQTKYINMWRKRNFLPFEIENGKYYIVGNSADRRNNFEVKGSLYYEWNSSQWVILSPHQRYGYEIINIQKYREPLYKDL